MHVMIDLETGGVDAGCQIFSIGAVRFDPRTGQTNGRFYAEVSHASYENTPFFTDPDTMQWWKTQPINPPDGDKPINEVLRDFADWLQPDDRFPWANSPSFDLVILRKAYQLTKIEPPPLLHFSRENDLRTIRRLARHTEPLHNTHNALSDALNQVDAVIQCYKYLGLNTDDSSNSKRASTKQWAYQPS